VIRPGSPRGLKIPIDKYFQLRQIAVSSVCPAWLVDAARSAWNLEISERAVDHAVIVRMPSPYGYGRASYELNLGFQLRLRTLLPRPEDVLRALLATAGAVTSRHARGGRAVAPTHGRRTVDRQALPRSLRIGARTRHDDQHLVERVASVERSSHFSPRTGRIALL
jgi:hypothetical protein